MKEQATASKYEKIKAFLLEEALKPESRLKMPTVQELMRKFGASQSPVSRAIRDLERDGVVRCRRGSGMVSCSVPVHEESFLKTAEESGKTVLFLRTDYFAESLWNMEHTILSYARQSRISVINYQMGQDADIMAIIETVQASHSLSGIVMNIKTGEVLAMANLPDFDPNDAYHLTSEVYINELKTDVQKILTDAKIAAVIPAESSVPSTCGIPRTTSMTAGMFRPM